MKKIIIYSHDGFGLGNIRRMLAIATYLSRQGYTVLILSGSPMLHSFRVEPGIDYVKLPCLGRDCQGAPQVKTLAMEYDAIVKLRTHLICTTIANFQPDLLLVDKKPLGLSHELAPALETLRGHQSRPKIVLLLRDILDSAEATIPLWKEHRYHDVIQRYYDLLLVVGTPDIFDLGKEYRFPASSQNLLRYCGYVKREKSHLRPQQLRQRLKVKGRPLVLVTTGGGGDGYRLITTYLEGVRHGLGRMPKGCRSLIFCGPELPDHYRQHIKQQAKKCRNVLLQDFTDDLMSYMEASDLVVSMGGYNTVCEIQTLNKPAVIVPRTDPVQEQWIRSRRMSEFGMLSTLHPDHLTPSNLMRMASEELLQSRSGNRSKKTLALDGLDHIGRWINGLLSDSPPVKPSNAAVPHASDNDSCHQKNNLLRPSRHVRIQHCC